MRKHLDKIGRRAVLIDPNTGTSWHVVVQDVRSAYGRIDYLVSPEAGSGSQWVSGDRIEMVGDTGGGGVR